MKLTTRQCVILEKILNTDGFITLQKLAERLNLSPRTVQREINEIKNNLNIDNWIESKSSSGIRFSGTEMQRKEVEDLLSKSKLTHEYSQNERITGIIYFLLVNYEPQKIFTISKMFNVTEATIGTDLNKCEEWLNLNNIKLIRRQGLGIFVEADEWQRRRALMRLYYSSQDDADNLSSHHQITTMQNLFDEKTTSAAKLALEEVDQEENFILNDRSRSALLLHLIMIVKRVESHASITDYDVEIPIGDDVEHLSNKLIKKIERYCQIDIPETEKEYLKVVLITLQGLRGFKSDERLEKAQMIADNILLIAESKTGVIIERESSFYTALVNHLLPMLERLKIGVVIRNPMLNEIKEHYPQLYGFAQICAEYIEQETGFKVAESEIGYIAIHLGVALEDSKSQVIRKCRAVVCCPSGMVTSQLLALRINREFPDIEVVDVISTANIDNSSFENDNVEMIISTAPLKNIDIPCVVVSPFLHDHEKDKVWEIIKVVKSKLPKQNQENKIDDFTNNLQDTKEIIEAILQILRNFFVQENETMTVLDIIDSVAERLNLEDGQKSQLIQDIEKREKIGSTITEDGKIMLLHCRSEAVNEVIFGTQIVLAGLTVNGQKREELKLVIIMLAPLVCSKKALETISTLSQAIIEENDFATILRSKDPQKCYEAVEKELSAFYQVTRK